MEDKGWNKLCSSLGICLSTNLKISGKLNLAKSYDKSKSQQNPLSVHIFTYLIAERVWTRKYGTQKAIWRHEMSNLESCIFIVGG